MRKWPFFLNTASIYLFIFIVFASIFLLKEFNFYIFLAIGILSLVNGLNLAIFTKDILEVRHELKKKWPRGYLLLFFYIFGVSIISKFPSPDDYTQLRRMGISTVIGGIFLIILVLLLKPYFPHPIVW